MDYVRGDRKEVIIRHLMPSEEIGKMMREKGKEVEEESEEAVKRKSFERGPSVESEFRFTKAVIGYNKMAIKEGSFKGRQIGNAREQLASRAGLEEKERGKK